MTCCYKGTLMKRGKVVQNWKERRFVMVNGIMRYYETYDDQTMVRYHYEFYLRIYI
jgi:hypothetical protein